MAAANPWWMAKEGQPPDPTLGGHHAAEGHPERTLEPRELHRSGPVVPGYGQDGDNADRAATAKIHVLWNSDRIVEYPVEMAEVNNELFPPKAADSKAKSKAIMSG